MSVDVPDDGGQLYQEGLRELAKALEERGQSILADYLTEEHQVAWLDVDDQDRTAVEEIEFSHVRDVEFSGDHAGDGQWTAVVSVKLIGTMLPTPTIAQAIGDHIAPQARPDEHDTDAKIEFTLSGNREVDTLAILECPYVDPKRIEVTVEEDDLGMTITSRTVPPQV